MARLSDLAHRFGPAGAFHGGPWDDPSKLVPALVSASLMGEGVYPTVESLSMLRLLALAAGKATDDRLPPVEARDFLGEVCAKNVEFLVASPTEEHRLKPKLAARARRLFARVVSEVKPDRIFSRIVEELELIAAQRPILTERLAQLVSEAETLRQAADKEVLEAGLCETLDRYLRAKGCATPLSERAPDLLAYRRLVTELDVDAAVEESRTFAAHLRATGLASPFHAAVLRRVSHLAPERIGEALCATEAGEAESRRCAELVHLLVAQAIVPATHFAILGLANALERSLLSRKEVAGGLRKIADLAILPEVKAPLVEGYPESSGVTANSALLAGCLAVLGQPIGIGQGNNPTCQSARGISLWSQHAPGQLLAMVSSVARDGFYATTFEGQPIRSDEIAGGVAAAGIEADLDPVSQVLVPHLDRVYDHMMRLASLRPDDGHRWVNPALYGRWIPTGFATAFEIHSSAVARHETFIRKFYASHHPEYNDGHELIYPNPVGIMVTDSHGRLLGRHAVSIQRIALPPREVGADHPRVYFFNPNNEGRQDWGAGVSPTVANHGECHGESSLPFAEFTSRLYAFHYDPQEEGDAYAVPAEIVARVHDAAATTWGRAVSSFD